MPEAAEAGSRKPEAGNQNSTNRQDELRRQALRTLQDAGVLMRQGHFDYGNGFHGRVYLNPHQLFRYPSTIWRLAQDLLDVLPGELLERTEVVAGPATGGALLAHTLAGLLDGRRALTHPPCSFAPFTIVDGSAALKGFYAQQIHGKRVLLADDVRNTGKTFEQCAALVRQAGGTVLASVEICDRMEAVTDAGVPNYALVEYRAPENFPAAECPMCKAGEPITSF
jgi:orotate phosphoribosyltransferase